MKSVSVLIVEDDRINAMTLQQQLKDESYELVGRAISGSEAIELCQTLKPDIVLMDIHLEGSLDGVDAAKTIQRDLQTPVIFLTGDSDSNTIERAKQSNAFGFLLKPFNARELAISIEMAIYKNESELKLSKTRLRLSTILSNIPNAVIHTDSNLDIAYMNPSAELFTERDFEDCFGQNLWKVLSVCNCETLEEITEPQKHILHKNPEAISFAKSGQRRILSPYGDKITNLQGELQGYIFVFHDITEQYKAEKEANRMATALASLKDAAIITECHFTDKGPEIVYANQAFEELSGYDNKSAVNKVLFDLISPINEDADSFIGNIQNSMDRGVSFQGEADCAVKDNKKILCQWSVSTVYDKSGKPVNRVFIISDVSNIRKLEENIRQSQKIEAVGQLAGGIAHDFNNLLSVINSYSELLSLKIDKSSPHHKYAEQIRAAGKKGANLIAQLMTFSRKEKPNSTNLQLPEVCDEVKNMLSRVIRENITLTTRYQENVWDIKADQGRIEQCLINLCVNARDAMASGGSICLSVQNQNLSIEEATKIGLAQKGRFVRLSVEDSGCGMDDETIKHIFDPFFTTKEVGKGTGLGLSTVFGIMKQLKGCVHVRSTIGTGTSFELYFPASSDIKACDINEEDQEAPKGSETILVIEDDPTFLDCITNLLELHGYTVKGYTNGMDALEHKPCKAKLLISDIVLPKISGREIAGRMLDENPDMKVIFMTGYDDQLDTFYSFPGDTIVLEKPFPLNTLLHKVREILDSKAKNN